MSVKFNVELFDDQYVKDKKGVFRRGLLNDCGITTRLANFESKGVCPDFYSKMIGGGYSEDLFYLDVSRNLHGFKKEIVERVMRTRYLLGLKQEELAVTIGVSRQTLSHIERGMFTRLNSKIMDSLQGLRDVRMGEIKIGC